MGDLSAEAPMHQLDPAVVVVWRAVVASIAAPLVILAAGAAGVTGHGWVWAVALVVLLAAASAVLWLPRAAYERFRWGIGDGIVRIEHGIVLRTQASVPVFRIQYIDLTQGPVDRWAGVQRLVVHTAAPAADLELPGIASSDAPRLRDELLALAREAAVAAGTDGTVDAV